MSRLNRYERVELGRIIDLAFAKVVIKNPGSFGRNFRPADPNPFPRFRIWGRR